MLLLLFFGGNLLMLTRYPFIHSDESWLAGLTRQMMAEGSLAVTEPFFDLKPRFPHAIKSLFHLLQMPFLALFGFEAFSVRLLSLLGGAGVLALFWRAARRMTHREGAALLLTALLACDGMFVNAAHLARQEILLCAGMVGCLLLLLREEVLRDRTVLLLALLTGLMVGLHPNSFLVACMCGAVLLMRWICFGSVSGRQIVRYIAVTGGLAAVFVAASFGMDPQFPAHYLAYGESEFDLLVPITSKFGELPYFFQKLWHRVSGTYHLPELRLQLLLFPALLVLAGSYAAVMRREQRVYSQKLASVVAAVVGILAGMVAIGRYNQNGFVFFVPICWLLLPHACAMCGRWPGRVAFMGVFVAVAATTVIGIMPWLTADDYEGYLDGIAASVPADARVIGNLNSGFYFENGCLLDYRNLSFLDAHGQDFAGYVRENRVEYLLVSQELERIYRVRPTWNAIYGNLSGWYPQMEAFVAQECELVGRFSDPVYGARVIEWIGDPQVGEVSIYRVKTSDVDG